MGNVEEALPGLNRILEGEVDSGPVFNSDESTDTEGASTSKSKLGSPLVVAEPQIAFPNRFDFNYTEQPVRYNVYHNSPRSFNLAEELIDCRPKHISTTEEMALQDSGSDGNPKRTFSELVSYDDVVASSNFESKRSIWKKLGKFLRKRENCKISVLNQYKFPPIAPAYDDESATKTVTFHPDVTIRETWSTTNYTRVDPMLGDKLAVLMNSPEQIEQIQHELNELKNEMNVHIQSRYNTQFFNQESRVI